MNYNELINRIKSVLDNHGMINEVGEGAISDINYPKDGQSPDYPYAFININDLNIGRQSFSLRFNLIVMTQCLDENITVQQSNMIEIINDVYATLLGSFDDPFLSINDNINITPFKERFADLVVGGTANITINYAKSLNRCELPLTISPVDPNPPYAIVIDGDGSSHQVDAYETYTCLPATAKEGIFYQRVIPWDGNDPSLTGSVYWHVQNGTYRYTPPVNPLYIACKADKYAGDDANCLLMQKNAFDNFFRFTNDKGQQFTENFHKDPANLSENPQYCIDHLTGLAFYVQRSTQEKEWRSYVQAIDYANNFSYGGYDDWRLADVAEYLGGVSYNDWINSFNLVYCPFVDEGLRNYGGRLTLGSFTRDNQYLTVVTNGPTIGVRTDINELYGDHLIMVRNHYIAL